MTITVTWLRLAVLTLLAGCHAADPIPTYASRSVADSFDIMRERAGRLHDLSGDGTLTLTDAAGKSVVLDAAFALAPPDRARVRASKFGQAVLDLTIKPEGAWLYQARRGGDYSGRDRLGLASADARQAIAAWLPLLADGFAADTPLTTATPTTLVVHRPAPDGTVVVCTIDRRTLTPRQYRVSDTDGTVRFTLDLADYRVVGPTVWPTKVTATSAGGTMTIALRNVEANAAPAGAFDPPARAEKLP